MGIARAFATNVRLLLSLGVLGKHRAAHPRRKRWLGEGSQGSALLILILLGTVAGIAGCSMRVSQDAATAATITNTRTGCRRNRDRQTQERRSLSGGKKSCL